MDKKLLQAVQEVYPLMVQQYEQYLPDTENPTAAEKINSMITALHHMGRLTNHTVKQWNDVMKWIVDSGVETLTHDYVNEEIKATLNDGRFVEKLDTTINQMHTHIQENLTNFSQTVKETKEIVDALERGIGETFDTFADLVAEYPSGHTKDHVVAENGVRYYWSDVEQQWLNGGLYQAIQLSEENQEKIDSSAKSTSLKNYAVNGKPDTITYYTFNESVGTGSVDTVNHEVSFTPTAKLGQVNYGGFRDSGLKPLGKTLYVTFNIKTSKTEGTNTISALLQLPNSTSLLTGSLGEISTEYQRKTLIFKNVPENFNGFSVLRLYDNADSDWGTTTITNIAFYDITEAFGEGNEPSKEFLDSMNIPFLEYPSRYNTGVARKSNFSDFAEHSKTAETLSSSSRDTSFHKPLYISLSNGVVDVVSKYSETHDLAVRMGRRGVNSIFEFISFSKIANETSTTSNDLSIKELIHSTGTDWHGPYIVFAKNNIDGEQPEKSNFTGGNHGYDNGGGTVNNSATGRTEYIDYYVEGRKVEAFEGYANHLEIRWKNHIQASNTTKFDGTGREVLEEEWYLKFDGVEWYHENTIEFKEDVLFRQYYGLQCTNGIWGGEIYYHSSENKVWNDATIVSNSISKNCDKFTMKKDDNYIDVSVNVNNGLGKRNLLTEIDYGATASATKKYMFLVRGDNNVLQGEVFTLSGSYKFYNKRV